MNESLKQYIKANWLKAVIFVVGVVVTLLFTKACDRIFPDAPVVVREVMDTIKIVHTYDFNLDNDSIVNSKLKIRLENIALSEQYDEKVKNKMTKNSSSPNLIITSSVFDKAKGYSIGNAMPYFSLKMSSLDGHYIDFEYDFINNEILKEIYSLSLKIYKIEDGKRIYVMDENYSVKRDKNLIRINNMLSQGRYEIQAGFTFKKDIDEEYPTFYRIERVLEKF